MICTPIAASSNQKMLDLLAKAEAEPADLHELRLDALKEEPDVEALVAASTRPVIATCRALNEGGGFGGDGVQRRSILRRAVKAGAAYIDAEPYDLERIGDTGRTIRIASLHDFTESPADLERKMFGLAARASADWVKFAVAARRSSDNLRVFAAIAKCPKPAIGIAMGNLGIVSRILGLRFGSRITFGSLDQGLESAPGQPTTRDLAELYRVRTISDKTAIHGLVGSPSAQFPAHILQNHAFAEEKADAVCIPFPVVDMADFLATMPDALNICRLSIVNPHQEAALAWAGQATDAARAAGKADMLTRTDGGWLADYQSKQTRPRGRNTIQHHREKAAARETELA